MSLIRGYYMVSSAGVMDAAISSVFIQESQVW